MSAEPRRLGCSLIALPRPTPAERATEALTHYSSPLIFCTASRSSVSMDRERGSVGITQLSVFAAAGGVAIAFRNRKAIGKR